MRGQTITAPKARVAQVRGFLVRSARTGLELYIPASRAGTPWAARCYMAQVCAKGLTGEKVTARGLTAKAVHS